MIDWKNLKRCSFSCVAVVVLVFNIFVPVRAIRTNSRSLTFRFRL